MGKETKEMKMGLGRIRKVLKDRGFKNSFKSVIVAGSNGKSQTAVFLEQMFLKAGIRTGCYISPHLIGIGERLRINGRSVSDSLYYSLMRKLKKEQMTYFEYLTAAAFLYFEAKGVSWVVAEVGLGGRLDATNILKNSVSVITNICREHTEWLGNTEEEIAREKAGIIKKGNTVVTAARGAALTVIRKIAKERNAKLIIPHPGENHYDTDFMNENYSLAASAFEAAGYETGRGFYPGGFLPSRFEKRRIKGMTVIIDGGHTMEACRHVIKEIRKFKKPRVCLFYALKDKKIEEMLRMLGGSCEFKRVICSSFPHERGMKPDEIEKRIPLSAEGAFTVADSIYGGFKEALHQSPATLLCFGSLAGSAYLKRKIIKFAKGGARC